MRCWVPAVVRREFSICPVKKEATQWDFPLAWDDCRSNPLAGPLSELAQRRLETKIDSIPHARRIRGRRTTWKMRSMQLWLTSDGSFFVEGESALGAIWELFIDLQQVMPELVIEDRNTEVLHNEASLYRLMVREQAALAPFEMEEGTNAA